jgi:arylsulfatase
MMPPLKPTHLRAALLLCVLLLVAVGGALLAGRGRHGPRLGPPAGAAPPSILLLGIDTFREDHLGPAGPGEPSRTPHLDALARDGVRFERCLSTAPWTLPSFASIFTGLRPYRHGAVGGDRDVLPDRHTTLAEHLAAAGYATVGFVGINYLTAQCGMAQGYVSDPPRGTDLKGLDQASSVTRLSGDFFGQHRDRPCFVFSHYFDPHAPYAPPPPWHRMYYRGDECAPGEPLTARIMAEGGGRGENAGSGMYDWLAGVTDPAYPAAQYAAEVSYTDDHVGRLVARLKELGLYERMLIVVVADHGEHLTEHGNYYTHHLPYQETIHVPLIVKLPGNAGAGRVVDEPVSTLDILPTVLEAAGLAVPDSLDGRSLAGLLLGSGKAPERDLLAEQGSDPELFCKTLVAWPWKLMLFREDGRERTALYDLAADPLETRDVSADDPETAAQLLRRLRATFDPAAPLGGGAPGARADLGKSDIRLLESLGYVHKPAPAPTNTGK